MDDDILAIIECQQGKNESYRVLVEKYKTRAYHAALLYTGNSQDALDLSQEAFVKAFQSIKSFQIGKNFYTWLYQILKNLCINHFKKIKRRNVSLEKIEEDYGSEIFFSPDGRPDEIFEEHEMREVLWKALKKLKAEDREIILLKEFNELSYQEISDVLGIPIGSVMSRLFYARKKLAKQMEEMI